MKGYEEMKELKGFVKGLQKLGYRMVSVSEVFSDDNLEFVRLEDLVDKVKELSVKETIAEYFESFEFIASDGKYIELNAVY